MFVDLRSLFSIDSRDSCKLLNEEVAYNPSYTDDGNQVHEVIKLRTCRYKNHATVTTRETTTQRTQGNETHTETITEEVAHTGNPPAQDAFDHRKAVLAFLYVATFLYWPLFEASRLQATPGKLALGIIVTDLQGRRIGLWTAIGRTMAKLFSMLFPVDFLGMLYKPRKQSWHDRTAGTLVVEK